MPVNILCVHGVGHQSEQVEPRNAWKQSIKDVIAKTSPNPSSPLDIKVDFLSYDEVFLDPRFALTAGVWVRAAARLGTSWWEHGIAREAAPTRGWFGDLSETVRWTAGMVVEWADMPDLRAVLRDLLAEKIKATKAQVVVAHSLGSLITYDALVRGQGDGVKLLITLGSQVGHPAVRNVFAGRLVATPQNWFHLYNPQDHVFTAPIDLPNSPPPRFQQLTTNFDVPNDVMNHDVNFYIRNENAQEAWAAVANLSTSPKSRMIAPPVHVSAPQRSTRALIVGIDEYANPNNNLEGCVNDAYLVSQTLQEANFDPSEIRLLVNGRATASMLRDRLEWLLSDVRPGDVRYFHYSGHGAQIPEYGPAEEVDHLNECLCPHDFDFSDASAISDKWFHNLYAQLPYDSYFVATLDCCHSGGMTRAGGRVRGLSLPDDILHRILRWDDQHLRWERRQLAAASAGLVTGKLQSSKRLLAGYVGASHDVFRFGRGVSLRQLTDAQFDRIRGELGHSGPFLPVLMEACAEGELAQETRRGNTPYGAFTLALTDCIRHSLKDRMPTYRQLIDDVGGRMGATQHPQLVGPSSTLNSPVPLPIPPTKPPVAIRSIAAVDPIEQAIQQHAADLLKIPGVVAVSAGRKFTDGWVTKDRAVVVTVLRKLPRKDVPKGQLIPAKLTITGKGRGRQRKNVTVLVDVGPANPLEQLHAMGVPLENVPGTEARYAARHTVLQDDSTARSIRKPTAEYEPPESPSTGLPLVEQEMSLTLHNSPANAFSLLSEFFSDTKDRLAVGMYDFTAPHIEAAIIDALRRSPRALTLVLDPGESLGNGGGQNNPKAGDLHEVDIRNQLVDVLTDRRFEFRWAAVKRRGKTNGGLFPSAYHLKVAVRDGEAFWLSSGNWQSTNQPDHDLPAVPKSREFRPYNREWHVIIENKTLAAIYEKYISHDYEQAEQFQDESPDREFGQPFDLLVPDDRAFAKPLRTFPDLRIKSRKVKVQPLLTPDNYAGHVLRLIQSAKKSLWLQNQYIHLVDGLPASDLFVKLCTAVRDAATKRKLDVRLILRDLGDARTMVSDLVEFGIPEKCIRLQKNCHNKGIIVDGETVLIGSHNWSHDGTTSNRDASLIFFDQEIANYYAGIFDFDWNVVAAHRVSGEREMPVVIRAGAIKSRDIAPHLEQLPSRRLSWEAYYVD